MAGAIINSDIIYDQISFQECFRADLQQAKQEIVIVSPYVTQRRVRWLEPVFAALTDRGISVTIITRPPSSFQGHSAIAAEAAICELKRNKVSVILRKGIHQKHAVIDASIVWYGSINLLSFGTSQESIMRLVSSSIARALDKNDWGT